MEAALVSEAVAFILVETANAAKARDVYNALLRITGVAEAYPLFGECDIIAKVEAENYEAISEIYHAINTLAGVVRTRKLDSPGKHVFHGVP